MTSAGAWLLLILSGLVDVAWAFALKRSHGFSDPLWSFLSILLLALFVFLLVKALEVLPLGTAYVVWTGIGAVGTLAVAALLLGDSISGVQLAFATITLVGIFGLKISP